MTKVFCCKTKKLRRVALMFLCGTALLTGCKDDFDGEFDKPSDMEGPIYEQLSSRAELSEFVKFIDKAPLMKSIINTSGLYTAFAPTNKAIEAYFKVQTRYPGKKGVEDFDVDYVDPITKTKTDSILLCQFIEAHFAIDMYFHYDFKKFIPSEILSNAGGLNFGNGTERNRYSTRYRDQKYIDTVAGRFILDENGGQKPRTYKVRPQNKSVTMFPYKYLRRYSISKEFMDLYGLTETPGGEDLYVNGIRVKKVGDDGLPGVDVAAENGVVHIIEGVIEPKENLDMMIKRMNPTMWCLLQANARYSFNSEATESEGIGKFDSIFTKSYNDFNVADEYGRNLMTFLMPGEGFEKFVRDSIFPTYGIQYEGEDILKVNVDSIPSTVRSMLMRQFTVPYTVWSNQLNFGFRTGSGDTLQAQDQKDRKANVKIMSTNVASNGLVYQLDPETKYISSVFNTVAKVPVLNRRYKWYLDFATETGMIGTYSQHWKKYTVFIPDTVAFHNEPVSVYRDGKEGNLKRKTDNLTVKRIFADSVLKYLTIEDVVLTPDSLKKKQFRKTMQGSFLQIEDGTITFVYANTETGAMKLDTFTTQIPTKPYQDANGNIVDPNGYIETVNGIVYPIVDYVPIPATITLNGYMKHRFNSTSSPNRNFYAVLNATKVYGDLVKGDKGYDKLGSDSTKTILQLLLSEDRKSDDIYTVFYPSNEAMERYITECGPVITKAWTTDLKWQKIARHLLVKTRVYTDGSHVQNFYDIYSNPMEGEKDVFLTQCYRKICKDSVYFEDNEYSKLQLEFENGDIILTDTAMGQVRKARTTAVKDVECVNGVFHEIDEVPFPVMKTVAEWNAFLERKVK